MFKKKTLVMALAVLASAPAWANLDMETLMQEMRRLASRVEQLESANQQLRMALNKADPAISARVEDLENEVVTLRERPSPLGRLEGVSAGASLTMVAQRLSGSLDESQLSARADVEVEMPGGVVGDAEGRIFAHLRAGDGDGVNNAAFATSNATAFNFLQPVLMHAWYQLDVPMGGGAGELGQLEITAGKIDPFGFFDGNNAADDESEQFLNLAFIHNPLLDAGGDIGVGQHGASPGLRLAYVSDINGGNHLTSSLGLFGSAAGADYDRSFTRPLTLAQVEYAGKTLGGLEGTYRAYFWNNANATDQVNLSIDSDGDLVNDLGVTEVHKGLGLSFDQQVSSHASLFARYGHSLDGHVAFDRAFTLGAQITGLPWGRENDRLGLAVGWLRASDDYKLANPGFSGAETPVELYYAWQVSDQLQITPSLQWIGNPTGDPAADDATVLSLRVKASL